MDSIEEVDVGSSDISEDSFEETTNDYDADIDNITKDIDELEETVELHLKSSIPHTVCMTREGPKIDIADEVTLTFSPKIDVTKDVVLTTSPVKKRRGIKEVIPLSSPSKQHQGKVGSLPSSPCKKLGAKKPKIKKNLTLEEGKKEIEAKLREMRRTEIDQVLKNNERLFLILYFSDQFHAWKPLQQLLERSCHEISDEPAISNRRRN